MHLVTADEMRRIDRAAIESVGIPSLQLMETAGAGAFRILQKNHPDLSKKSIIIVAGKGHNAGDGFVLARLALKEVSSVTTLLTTPPDEIKGDALVMLEKLKAAGGRVEAFRPDGLRGADIVVDALFGTGLSKPVEGVFRGAIESIRSVSPRFHWVVENDVRALLKPRSNDTHKGTYGHLLLIGGSANKPGAILLAGKAALRTGAGLATVVLPDKAFQKFPGFLYEHQRAPCRGKRPKHFLELMYEPQASTAKGFLGPKGLWHWKELAQGKTAVAAGPGMGLEKGSLAWIDQVLNEVSVPVVLDADALNLLAQDPKRLKKAKKRGGVILTPHPKEMARLTGKTTAHVQSRRLEVAEKFARDYGVHLVLKGYRTVIATPEGEVFINSTGNPGMATAGMGDVLTGMIGSLLAQGLTVRDAAVAGVYLHGRAGDRVAERLGDRGLLASDLIEEIPLTIKEIISKS